MKGEFSGKDGVRDREGIWCRQSFLQKKQLLEMKTQVCELRNGHQMTLITCRWKRLRGA